MDKPLQKKWIKYFDTFDINEDMINQYEKGLRNKFKQEVLRRDLIWGLLNEVTLKTTDKQELKGIYYTKALFLNEEGKDCTTQLQESAKLSLLIISEWGANKVEIITCSDSCEGCKKLSNKVFTIKEALAKMPIPCKSCSYKLRKKRQKPFCRCEYVVFYDD